MSLNDLAARPVTVAAPAGVAVHGLGLGQGTSAIEVLLCSSTLALGADQVRLIWRTRHAGRAAPVMVIVQQADRVQVCGPFGDPVLLYESLDAGQVERIARDALAAPDRHAALRLLRDALPAANSELPGIRNEGLLATHELKVGVKAHADYAESHRRAAAVVGREDRALLEALGYRIERLDNSTSVLRSRADKRVALAVLLQKTEAPEVPAARFSDMTPLSYALSVADRERLPWVVVCQGSKLRL